MYLKLNWIDNAEIIGIVILSLSFLCGISSTIIATIDPKIIISNGIILLNFIAMVEDVMNPAKVPLIDFNPTLPIGYNLPIIAAKLSPIVK